MPPSALSRLRKLRLGLPEAHELKAWGREPTFRVKELLRDGYRMTAPKNSSGDRLHATHGNPVRYQR